MEKVEIMALGGLDEDGKNMYLIEIDGDIFIVDCGLKYPSESTQLGINYIIPDFSYLLANKERVKAAFITHGHDDVMAALPHLIKELEIPVYVTPLTAKLLEIEFKKNKVKHHKFHIIQRQDTFKVAGHKIHTFPVVQSIPDGFGLSFETDHGQIVYTSEFIVDYDFISPAFSMDVNAIAEMGKNNVLCLLTESGGAGRNGYTSPRHRISDIMEPHFETHENRILVTLYKQNLFRIIEFLELAHRYNRRVLFLDEKNVDLLKEVEALGYYSIPKNLLIDKKDFKNEMEDVLIIVSGSGNEVFKIMNRIAINEDALIELRSSDKVIISSPVVPGTEKEASDMENDLYKCGVSVVKVNAKEVLSMHASIEDIKMMLFMLKPRYFLPVRGDYANLVANAKIATSMGYLPKRIIILDNGQFATFEDGRLVSSMDKIKLVDTMIDGNDKLDVQGMVLKDRETLSTDGLIVAGVFLNFKTKEICGGPDVQSRGVIYLKDADHIVEQIGKILIDTINTAVKEKRYENMATRMEAKEKIQRYMLKETGKRPMILPAIIEINLEG